MFESGKKREPKLVFAHKSSPPTVVATRTTEPQQQIPRFTVVANGQLKQSKGDDNVIQTPKQTVASNSTELTNQKPQQNVSNNTTELPSQKPQQNVVISNSGSTNQKIEQTVANSGTGLANHKSQQTVANSGTGLANHKSQQTVANSGTGLANQKLQQAVANNGTELANQKAQQALDGHGTGLANQKIQYTVVNSGNGFATQKHQQIFQQTNQQPRVEQQSLQKQAANQPAQQQPLKNNNEQQPQGTQLQKEQQSQGAHVVNKEQVSRNGQIPPAQLLQGAQLQTAPQPMAVIHQKDQAQHKERNETRPPENTHKGFSKVFIVSDDREMQQATITFTEEKNADTNKNAALTEQPNGYANVYPPQSFRKDSDASMALPTSTQDPKNNTANHITEQFEGFSIYRGRQETPNSKQPIGKEKTATVNSTPSTIQNSSGSVNNTAKSISASIVVTPNAIPNKDDDSVILRHPKNFVAVSSAQKQQPAFQQAQKQHQQYQKTHQLLQAQQQQQQAVFVDPYRQGDYRYQTMPNMRVYSYPQAARQPAAKAIRLVGSYIQEPGYQQPSLRHAAALKNRSFSASSAAPVRYPGGAAQWQASPTQGYYVYTEDTNTAPRVIAGPAETTYNPDAATFKHAQQSNNGQRPKSILKSPSISEAPEWHSSARPMKLPRPQSMINSSTNSRDFDFSTILTANSDIVSYTKHPHHHGRSQAQTHTPPNRPVSAGGANPQRPEATQDGGTGGAPLRKSVTFNSQVRLHTEDRVSMVTALVVDS